MTRKKLQFKKKPMNFKNLGAIHGNRNSFLWVKSLI